MGRVWLGTTTNGAGARTAGSDRASRPPIGTAARAAVAEVRMTEASIAVSPSAAGAVGPLFIHRSVAPSRPPAARPSPPRLDHPAADRRPWFRRWLSRS